MKLSRLVISTYLAAHGLFAQAWEPCMPFCDMSCAAPAIGEMGGGISGSFGELIGVIVDTSAAMTEEGSAVIDLGTSVSGSLLLDQTPDLLSAIDGFAQSYIAGMEVAGTTQSKLVDLLVATLHGEIESSAAKSELLHAKAMLPTSSFPDSAINSWGSARDLSHLAADESVVRAELVAVDERIRQSELKTLSGWTSLFQGAPRADETIWNMTRIDSASLDSAMIDLEVMSRSWDITGIPEDELQRRIVLERRVAAMRTVREVLSRVVSFRGETIRDSIKTQVLGRSGKEQWHVAVSGLNAIGLERELVILGAERMHMMYRRDEIAQFRNLVLALLASANWAE